MDTIDDFWKLIPRDTKVIGIELTELSTPLYRFVHPERCIYLLGSEDTGIPQEVINKCNHIVEIPDGKYCLNMAVAGSIVIYDRIAKCQRI